MSLLLRSVARQCTSSIHQSVCSVSGHSGAAVTHTSTIQSNHIYRTAHRFMATTPSQAKPQLKRGIPTHHDPNKTVQDKLLFTPGPLTTSYPVKQAMTVDLGSRDIAFRSVIQHVRTALLQVAKVSDKEFTTIPMQGSGTYGVESVVSSVVDKKQGGLLVLANGAYGLRIAKMAEVHHIPLHLHSIPDDQHFDLAAIEALLSSSAANVSHVAVVHSETTSGIINDIHSVGELVHEHGKSFIVDAMSSFGASQIDFASAHIDYLVSSANKCIEGVPGFAFIIARKSALANVSSSTPDTLSLNILAQLAGLDKDGQFRFTPPTHPLLAFSVALNELAQEGGVSAREKRYKENQQVLMDGMKTLQFKLYLQTAQQGHIISSYHYPTDSNWNFDRFYSELNDAGFVIYPGKVSAADCFRIGHIGRLFPEDTQALLTAIDQNGHSKPNNQPSTTAAATTKPPA